MAFFIPYKVSGGSLNMSLDEKLLDTAVAKEIKTPVLRLYGWKPACVSLGRNQKVSGVNEAFCKSANIDIVRRLTGGRGLLHDNELTYSFITPVDFLKNGNTVISSYKEISGALKEGFEEYNIELDFPQQKKTDVSFEYCMSLSTGADLSYNGKKLIGSAQFRKQNYILQHGSILIDYDEKKIEKIFSERPETSKIVTLSQIKPDFNIEELCCSLKIGFEKYFALNFDSVTDVNLV